MVTYADCVLLVSEQMVNVYFEVDTDSITFVMREYVCG